MSDNEIKLYVEGKEFTSWESVTISRSIEAAAGSFSLALVDDAANSQNYTIREGAECRVTIDGQTVITGYIDDVEMALSASDYSLAVSGRDKTCDLVDCSATGKPEIRNKSLIAIARELCRPFGIAVITDDGQDAAISVRLNPKAAQSVAQKARKRKESSSKFAGENIQNFRTQPGESVIDCLERVAREKGLLITSTPNGELLFTRSGKNNSGATIQEGKNLLDGRVRTSIKDRFSEYIVNGQQSGAEGLSGNRWKAFKSQTSDPAVKRYRPLVILAENAMGAAGARRRAAWEAAVRAARATTLEVSVPEWKTETGKIWAVNEIVRVEIPTLRITREMLVCEVNFVLDSGGRVTNLQLKRPDAFALETDIPLENNEPVKPTKPVKPKNKKPPIRKPPRQRAKPKPVSRSRDLVLNTATPSTETVA